MKKIYSLEVNEAGEKGKKYKASWTFFKRLMIWRRLSLKYFSKSRIFSFSIFTKKFRETGLKIFFMLSGMNFLIFFIILIILF